MNKMDNRGVSVIISELLLIGIIVGALSIVAQRVLATSPEVFYCNIWGRAENTQQENRIKLIFLHVGGDDIPKLKYLRVFALNHSSSELGVVVDVFTKYNREKLGFTDKLYVYVEFQSPVSVGQKVQVSLTYDEGDHPQYEQKWIYKGVIPIVGGENSFYGSNYWYDGGW